MYRLFHFYWATQYSWVIWGTSVTGGEQRKLLWIYMSSLTAKLKTCQLQLDFRSMNMFTAIETCKMAKQSRSLDCLLYAVKVRRHKPWSRGPLSWIPGLWFTLCQFRWQHMSIRYGRGLRSCEFGIWLSEFRRAQSWQWAKSQIAALISDFAYAFRCLNHRYFWYFDVTLPVKVCAPAGLPVRCHRNYRAN